MIEQAVQDSGRNLKPWVELLNSILKGTSSSLPRCVLLLSRNLEICLAAEKEKWHFFILPGLSLAPAAKWKQLLKKHHQVTCYLTMNGLIVIF